MCCLSYENDYYAEAFKKMPKLGSTVDTPEGKGAVISTDMLKMTVRVKIEKEGALLYRDFPVADVKFGNAAAQEEDDDGDGDKISE